MKKMLLRSVFAAALMSCAGSAASAGELTWAELKPTVYGDRLISKDEAVVKLDVPYRAKDDREVPVTVHAKLPDGAAIKTVTMIIDENPMPVSLSISPAQKRSDLWVSANMRFNGPSPVRAVVEAEDGRLFMSEGYVKTLGLGACASPPVTSMDEAIASLGNMHLSPEAAPLEVSALTANKKQRVRLEISHPNLTGLQMDQITLQYILPRYIDQIDVLQGTEPLATLEAGISLSENPSIAFDYVANGASHMTVTAKDTDDTVFKHQLPVSPGS